MGVADDLIEHGSHIDIRSARLFAGAHSAQVCSFIGKRSGPKTPFYEPETLSHARDLQRYLAVI